MGIETIYNYRMVDDQLSTAGQPTEAELRDAANAGVRTIINLAPFDPRYSLPDEAGLVETLGMAYHHIPVDWGSPTERDFAAFEQAMLARQAGKALIHCAANFRATAFYSLFAMKQLGWSAAQAEAFRASIWHGSDYPQWESFIQRMQRAINEPG